MEHKNITIDRLRRYCVDVLDAEADIVMDMNHEDLKANWLGNETYSDILRYCNNDANQGMSLYNVWADSQAAKTTIETGSELSAKRLFALRHGWLSDEPGYADFIESLNVEFVR